MSSFQSWYLSEKLKVIEEKIQVLKTRKRLFIYNQPKPILQMSDSESDDFEEELWHINYYIWVLQKDWMLLNKRRRTLEGI